MPVHRTMTFLDWGRSSARTSVAARTRTAPSPLSEKDEPMQRGACGSGPHDNGNGPAGVKQATRVVQIYPRSLRFHP